MSRPGQIVTFYSYKGGVGRSFALANIAVALTAWGYRVLCIDWDLEAPGLGHYFGQQAPQAGLVELIGTLSASRPAESGPASVPDWRDYVSTVYPASGLRLDLIAAGRGGADYVAELQRLRWDTLYEQQGLDRALETWRDGWRADYDFVLIDSRTGITDAGAVCTAHLPDLLVVMFTANRQSVDGCVDVVARAHAARRRLPFDRNALHVLPVPSRFDTKEEYRRAQEWQATFADKFGPLIASWKEENVIAGDILSRVTVPYVAYWSFGEGLPVLEEPARDPGNVRFVLETIAALLAQRLANTHSLLDGAEAYIQAAMRAAKRIDGFKFDVLLVATPDLTVLAQDAQSALEAQGLRVVHRTGNEGGSPESDDGQHAVFLVGRQFSPFVDAELKRLTKQMVDEAEQRFVVPVVFSDSSVRNVPAFLQRSAVRLEPGIAAAALADRIAAELGMATPPARESRAASPAAVPASPSGPPTPPEGAEEAVARQRLASPSPNIRRAAVAALGRAGNRNHIGALALRLADEEQRVRDEARRAIEEVVTRERQSDANFRIDESAIPTPSDPLDQAAVGDVLSSLGDPRGLDLLVTLLDHADERVRVQVARGLGASKAPAAAGWLEALIEDPSSEVAVAALVGKVKSSKRITPEVLELSRRFAPWEFEKVAQSVADAASELEPAFLHKLKGCLGTPEAEVLIRVLLGSGAAEALREWLLLEVEQGRPDSALAAAWQLASIQEPRLLAKLEARLEEGVPRFRVDSIRLLSRIDGAAPLIRKLMEDSDAEVRAAAVASLGELGSGDGAETALLGKLEDPMAIVRRAALTALRQVAGSNAAAIARHHLDDENSGVRAAALSALAAAPIPEDLAPLGALVSDRDARVRRELALALGALADNLGAQLLNELLDDGDADVRRAAVGGLATAAKLSDVERRLLSADLDGREPWIDVRDSVTSAWIKKAAKALGIPGEAVVERLGKLSDALGRQLKISTNK